MIEFVRIELPGLAQKSKALGIPGGPHGVDGRFWGLDGIRVLDYEGYHCMKVETHDLPRIDTRMRAKKPFRAGKRVFSREVKSRTERGPWIELTMSMLAEYCMRCRSTSYEFLWESGHMEFCSRVPGFDIHEFFIED